MTHPVEVACLLHEAGYPDEVVAAGVLHDVLEDTEVTRADLERRFGERVADLVAAVSEDPSIEDRGRAQGGAARAGRDRRRGRRRRLRGRQDLQDARAAQARRSRGRFDRRDRAKLDHYEASLDLLSVALPGSELVERLRTELEQVEPQPAAR